MTTDGQPDEDTTQLWTETGGGPGDVTLVLVHGAGCTAEVWRDLVATAETRWPGPWVILDLPGHGRSPRRDAYRLTSLADDVAAVLPRGPAVIVGHSLGGIVALMLASRSHDADILATVAIGTKLDWSDDELSRSSDLARRPARVFPTRDDAAQRFLLVSGLSDSWPIDDPRIGPGIRQVSGGWSLAADPATLAVEVCDVASLIAGAAGSAHLARGAEDPLVTRAEQLALDQNALDIPGAAHNAHVEQPAEVLEIALSALRTASRGNHRSSAARERLHDDRAN